MNVAYERKVDSVLNALDAGIEEAFGINVKDIPKSASAFGAAMSDVHNILRLALGELQRHNDRQKKETAKKEANEYNELLAKQEQRAKDCNRLHRYHETPKPAEWYVLNAELKTPLSQRADRKALVPKGKRMFDLLNFGRGWREKTAGYWRNTLMPEQSHGNIQFLPFPIVTTAKGYDRKRFCQMLKAVQFDDAPVFATRDAETGKLFPSHRALYQSALKSNGKGPRVRNLWTQERWPTVVNDFNCAGWKWRSDYLNYLEAGVLPSRAFYEFITGEDLDTLPDYRIVR